MISYASKFRYPQQVCSHLGSNFTPGMFRVSCFEQSTVADLEILKGEFSRLVGTYTAHRQRWCVEPQSGDQSHVQLHVLFSDQEALS